MRILKEKNKTEVKEVSETEFNEEEMQDVNPDEDLFDALAGKE